MGETALTVAAGAGHIAVVKLLLNAKANAKKANKVCITFLSISTTRLDAPFFYLTLRCSCPCARTAGLLLRGLRVEVTPRS